MEVDRDSIVYHTVVYYNSLFELYDVSLPAELHITNSVPSTFRFEPADLNHRIEISPQMLTSNARAREDAH